jgi:hypothetical protein
MALPTLDIDAGASRSWIVTVNAEGSGLPVTGLTSADTLVATVWPGDDRPELFAPSIAWIDPAAATCRIVITGAQSSALTPGRAFLRASVTQAGDGLTRTIFHARLAVAASPGTRVAPPCYGTADDVLQVAPWLADLASDSDQSNFAEAMGRARAWLDGLILTAWSDRNRYSDQWALSTTIGPSQWQRDQLAAGALIVRPETIEIVAHKAASWAMMHAIGDRGGTSYQVLARRYAAIADDLAICYAAELDITPTGGTADGIADVYLPLGRSNIR